MNGKQSPKKNQNKKNKKNDSSRNIIIWLLILIGLTYFFQWGNAVFEAPPKELSYGEFYRILQDNPDTNEIISAVLTDDRIVGKMSDGSAYSLHIAGSDTDMIGLLRDNVKDFDVKPQQTFLSNIFWAVIGPIVLVTLFWLLMYRGAAAGGGKVLSFGKSKARLATEGKLKITFNDVAGVDEAKEELKEVIDFLKDPQKFQKLGGKMPKGVLVMGPPGCGKTLLAKAVAGEAGVPFFSISGSDFVEMFVGVGASRVRDLFGQAKRSVKLTRKGCIIFLDEIDAVGRQRFAGIGGGHDEREQTLNALLVEMDGFDTQQGVMLIAATNRPDVLDPALLRPGRFDRQIVVDRPDINGRQNILTVHGRKIKLDKNADLNRLAKQTPGFSGADLANLINEAALLAARRDKKSVQMLELEESIERVMMGPQRRSKVISDEEKRVTAFHEAGHALLSLLLPDADPMHKVTIIPRGMALGYAMIPREKDRNIESREQLIADMTVSLGGAAAEKVIIEKQYNGTYSDMMKVSKLARYMITKWGMSETLGYLVYGHEHQQVFLGRDLGEERNYSEDTAKLIDKEVKKLVDRCFDEAVSVLNKNRDKLTKLAETLIKKEIMSDVEIKEMLGLEIKKEGSDSADIKEDEKT